MQTCQSALLLFKHQHNLLCPHLKSSRVVGLQERSTDNKRSALSAEAFVTTPPQSPPRSSNTQWRPTPLFRGNQKMVSMILFFIQLDIISVFAPLIERICSHYIHTYICSRTIKGIKVRARIPLGWIYPGLVFQLNWNCTGQVSYDFPVMALVLQKLTSPWRL